MSQPYLVCLTNPEASSEMLDVPLLARTQVEAGLLVKQYIPREYYGWVVEAIFPFTQNANGDWCAGGTSFGAHVDFANESGC